MPRIIKSAKGTFSTADITIDSSGRVVTAATGSAGGAVDVVRLMVDNAGNGTYTANPGANNASMFVKGGGGGGGGYNAGVPANPGRNGKSGGSGGFGFYFQPVSGGTGYDFTVGAQGNAGNNAQDGNAGGASNITNLATANGGNRGGSGGSNPGTTGSAPGAMTDLSGSNIIHENKGQGGAGAGASPATGQPGKSGFILVYDNSGT